MTEMAHSTSTNTAIVMTKAPTPNAATPTMISGSICSHAPIEVPTAPSRSTNQSTVTGSAILTVGQASVFIQQTPHTVYMPLDVRCRRLWMILDALGKSHILRSEYHRLR